MTGTEKSAKNAPSAEKISAREKQIAGALFLHYGWQRDIGAWRCSCGYPVPKGQSPDARSLALHQASVIAALPDLFDRPGDEPALADITDEQIAHVTAWLRYHVLPLDQTARVRLTEAELVNAYRAAIASKKLSAHEQPGVPLAVGESVYIKSEFGALTNVLGLITELTPSTQSARVYFHEKSKHRWIAIDLLSRTTNRATPPLAPPPPLPETEPRHAFAVSDRVKHSGRKVDIGPIGKRGTITRVHTDKQVVNVLWDSAIGVGMYSTIDLEPLPDDEELPELAVGDLVRCGDNLGVFTGMIGTVTELVEDSLQKFVRVEIDDIGDKKRNAFLPMDKLTPQPEPKPKPKHVTPPGPQTVFGMKIGDVVHVPSDTPNIYRGCAGMLLQISDNHLSALVDFDKHGEVEIDPVMLSPGEPERKKHTTGPLSRDPFVQKQMTLIMKNYEERTSGLNRFESYHRGAAENLIAELSAIGYTIQKGN